jgi:hypothetical protein
MDAICFFLWESVFVAAFRRVEDSRAGPTALGILVPPGRRTLVILRPRALGWDLVALRAAPGEAFQDFDRDEAAGVARRLQHALEQAVAAEANPLEVIARAAGEGFQVRLRGGEFAWVVCDRRPGQPYQPVLFRDESAAQEAVRRLAEVLWPRRDADQEYYFNTQNFSR